MEFKQKVDCCPIIFKGMLQKKIAFWLVDRCDIKHYLPNKVLKKKKLTLLYN